MLRELIKLQNLIVKATTVNPLVALFNVELEPGGDLINKFGYIREKEKSPYETVVYVFSTLFENFNEETQIAVLSHLCTQKALGFDRSFNLDNVELSLLPIWSLIAQCTVDSLFERTSSYSLGLGTPEFLNHTAIRQLAAQKLESMYYIDALNNLSSKALANYKTFATEGMNWLSLTQVIAGSPHIIVNSRDETISIFDISMRWLEFEVTCGNRFNNYQKELQLEVLKYFLRSPTTVNEDIDFIKSCIAQRNETDDIERDLQIALAIGIGRYKKQPVKGKEFSTIIDNDLVEEIKIWKQEQESGF